MHPNFADGALPQQVSMGLTRMAATPRRRRLFCSGTVGTLCGRGYGRWFCPSTGQRSGLYVYRVGVAPVLTRLRRLGPQGTAPGYPGSRLSHWQFISYCPWLNPDIKSYPVFRWTVEVSIGFTRPAAAARQPGAEMNETYGMCTSGGISQDNYPGCRCSR